MHKRILGLLSAAAFIGVAAGAVAFGAVTTILTAPPAHAEWYVSGNAGAVNLRDAEFTDTFTGGSATGDVEFDTGYGVSGALGYAWDPFRLEGEISYRRNDLDKVQVDTLSVAGVVFTSLGTFDFEGDTTALGFMANGWYDVDTGTPWVPFLGAGLGVARLNIDIESIAGVAITYDESDTVFAYQAGAGIGYKFTPEIMATLSYRFFGTSDPTFDDGVDKIEAEYRSHNIWAGLIFRF